MKLLWKFIDNKKWTAQEKQKTFLRLLCFLGALVGFCIWLVIRNWALSSFDWMLCFIGYPAIIFWLAAYIYSCNHNQ